MLLMNIFGSMERQYFIPSYFLHPLLSGGDGGPAAGVDAHLVAGELQQHDSRRDGPRRQAAARRAYGHAHRCLPSLHPEHLRCHPLHPSHVGGGHCRCALRLSHRVHVLLRHHAHGNLHERHRHQRRRARGRLLLHDLSIPGPGVRRRRRHALLHGDYASRGHVHRGSRRNRACEYITDINLWKRYEMSNFHFR